MSVRTVVTSMPTTSTRADESSRVQSITVVTVPPLPPPGQDAHQPHRGDSLEDGDEDGEEKEAEAEESKGPSIWQKLINWFTIICLFIESCVISATAKLNHVSRDYRYVSRRLAVEKRALKLLFEMEEAEGISYDTDWKKSTLEKISKASVPQVKRVESIESFNKLKRCISEDKLVQQKKSPTVSSEE